MNDFSSNGFNSNGFDSNGFDSIENEHEHDDRLNDLADRILQFKYAAEVDTELSCLTVRELERLKDIIFFERMPDQEFNKDSPVYGLQCLVKDKILVELHFRKTGGDSAEAGSLGKGLDTKVYAAGLALYWQGRLDKVKAAIDEKRRLASLNQLYMEAFSKYVDETKTRYLGGTLDGKKLDGRIKTGDEQIGPSAKRPYITICRDNSHEENLRFVIKWLERAKLFANEAEAARIEVAEARG